MVGTLATAVLLIVLGVVLAGLGVHQLGVVRAAHKWPAARQPRIGRGLSGVEVAVGIAAVTGGGVLLTTLLDLSPVVGVGVAAGTGLVVLVLSLVVAAKVADRVELNALIRSPSPLYRATAPRPGVQHQSATPVHRRANPPLPEEGSTGPDPSIPAGAQPGWVLTDQGGSFYLCVTSTGGSRIIGLPDFRLVPPDPARQLTLAGTVELSVWPLPTDTSDGNPPGTDDWALASIEGS